MILWIYNIITGVLACIGVYLIVISTSSQNYILYYCGIAILSLCALLFIFSFFLPRGKKHRSEFEFRFSCSPHIAEDNIVAILKKYNFLKIDYGGEEVYRLDKGWIFSRKFIKYELVSDTLVRIEAWVSGGVGKRPAPEMALDDKIYARFPKNTLKNIVTLISDTLKLVSLNFPLEYPHYGEDETDAEAAPEQSEQSDAK